VVQKDAGYAGLSDSLVDLRVDDHERPLDALRRLYDLHQGLYGATPPSDWMQLDETLREELRTRLARLGFAGDLEAAFATWAAAENLELRVDGIDRIDPVVLEHLRARS
jgi:uncharacterized Ntn-hydrolase superfamily protein